MDKYVKMLLTKLSPRYKVTVTTIMYYDDENERFSNIIKLRMQSRSDGEIRNIECRGKRELIGELIKWVND